MFKTTIVLFSTVILMSTQVRADVAGIQIGISAWTPDYSGEFALDGSASSGTPIDIADDLGFGEESHSDIWLKIEHPIPILPNFKLTSSDMEASASSTLSRDIDFGDETFPVSTDIDTRFDLSNTELTLYYELLDNWFNLDAGVTIRQYDGLVRISDDTIAETEDFDEAAPLLYLDARINLPFAGFFVDSTMNAGSFDDNSISDINVSLGYETEFGLGARLGYRTLEIEIEEDDVFVDLNFEGSYLNVFYHF